MHPKVEKFLELRRQAEAEDRERTLVRLGLWERAYCPEGEAASPAEYPEQDGDRRYRKAPLPVTEAEWAEIRRYAGRAKRNGWRTGLQVCGVLCCGGGLFSFFSGVWEGVLLCAVPAVALFGLAEVLRLVDR